MQLNGLVYWTGVLDWCTGQVYWTGVLYSCEAILELKPISQLSPLYSGQVYWIIFFPLFIFLNFFSLFLFFIFFLYFFASFFALDLKM